MRRRLHLTEPARADIDEIYYYTARTYNPRQADRYIARVQQALDDIEDEPERASSLTHPELGTHVRSYAISLSKERSGTGIKSPRHLLFYTLEHEGEIYVLRVLHDRMDPHNFL